jgi:uncharacterized protein YjdB
MKIGANSTKAAVVLLLAAALFAMAGVIGHGCGVTEYGEITLKSIKITPASQEVYSGATVAFKATGIYSDTTRKDITSKVTWESSGDEVAIDAATGLATAQPVSETYECTISASLNGLKGSTKMIVKVPTFTAISISAPGGEIARETSVQFTATGSLDDGTTQDITSEVTWASSDPAVVEIDASGKATGKSGGSAEITATYKGLTSNAVTVTVSDASLVSLVIQAAAGGSAAIKQTETVQFTATGTFNDGKTQDMTASAVWASSDETVATISAAGLATAKNKDGSADITASFSGVPSNAVTLTVSGPLLMSIAIKTGDDGTTNISAGSTKRVTAEATYSDNSKKDVTMEVTWSSSNLAVCEVVNTTATSVGLEAKSTVTTNTPVTITISLDGKTASVDYMVVPCGGCGGC